MTRGHLGGPSRRGQVPGFEVMEVVARVAQLRAEGHDVVSLCVGEPLAGAPAPVRQAMARAMDGADLGYSASLGMMPLREKLAEHYGARYGLAVDASRVAITTGSSGAFLLAFLSCFDAGDRVALARPGYPAYANILRSLDLEVVELDVTVPDETGRVTYQLTTQMLDAVQEQAPLAGLVVASPANPTGTTLTADEMESLAAWCREHGVRLVSDEIYHGITADGTMGECAWRHDTSALVVSSFSKYWGMTGWRLGWLLMPEDLQTSIDALSSNLALCAPVPAQLAALEAFGDDVHSWARAAVRQYDVARDVVQRTAHDLGWELAPADGAFYVYADISSSLRPSEDSRAWCTSLLEEARVAITPGWDFDRVHGGSTVRLSLAVGPEQVAEAMTRLRSWLAGR
ncbi:MAG: aminotransferase class I/II-fold pyridoxal phosphate-dependent enzyme [Luteococcus sp.]|uniref:pyridoxal phosphate-dependent aminotransferase n=1 Tax=Luteococcus sp. TaxID=1969402 RepID=UPI0026485E3D|nr:aminotransferase class I/II-fold pyridoxal phosphate-dependent enzyme [Luteococcus sp.]MDN5562487.1 aminotransferase class I/II-fold pyridoxal phosphate-dependent enzyme [Luteococcus sp.]